jgi:hypothetical protein
MFFLLGSGRILGGTQGTLRLLDKAGDTDMGDCVRVVGDVVDSGTLQRLLAGAEAAFNKASGQLMPFLQVRTVCVWGWVGEGVLKSAL